MTVTIWDTFANAGAGAIATRSEIIGWTEPEGDEAPEPIYGDPVPLARIAGTLLGRNYGTWARPTRSAEERADPHGHGMDNFLPGERILDDVDVKPTLGAYDRLGARDDGVPNLDSGTMVWTWAKISADEFNPATHHAPVWTGTEWAAPVAKSTEEITADWAAAGAKAKRRIEIAAEAERMKYLTAGHGKAMTYQAKHEEARRYAVDNDPQAASYPFAAAEAAVRGITLAAMITVWQANITAWAEQLGPAIEATEHAAKLDVDAAVTAKDAAALAAAEVVQWPS